MAQHIPFEHRDREVVYITDEPPKPSNGWGLSGFILSILALFTGGLLSPISMLLCFIGLFKSPRKWALIGSVISLLGISFVGLASFAAWQQQSHHRQLHQQHANQNQAAAVLEQARHVVNARADELSRLPDGITGNKITIGFRDPWGTELRYDADDNVHYLIRSAGPDGRFDSPDDVIKRVNHIPRNFDPSNESLSQRYELLELDQPKKLSPKRDSEPTRPTIIEPKRPAPVAEAAKPASATAIVEADNSTKDTRVDEEPAVEEPAVEESESSEETSELD